MRAACLAVLLAACREHATEAVVTVAVEGLNAPIDFDGVDIVVRSSAGAELSRAQVRPCGTGETPSPGGCVRLPFTVLLVPGSERPGDTALFEVSARAAGTVVAKSELALTFVSGSTVRMTLVLRRGVLDGGVVDQASPDDLTGVDGGATDAAPADLKPVVRRVFLSRERTGLLGGHGGAGNYCNQEAGQAQLTGNYAAIVGDPSFDPWAGIVLNAGSRPIVLPNGTQVATDQSFWQDFHLNDINQHADGTTDTSFSLLVWTGFTSNGFAHSGTIDKFCDGWFSLAANRSGFAGYANGHSFDGKWADGQVISPTCDMQLPFYCIEQ